MDRFQQLTVLYLAYLIPTIFAHSFTAYYLLQVLAVGLNEFLLLMSITFATAVAAVSLRQCLSTKKAFTIAGVVVAIEFLLLAFPVHKAQLYVYSFLYGLMLCYFWMVFNAAFFRGQAYERNATRSAYYYAAVWILSALLPLASIIVIERFGFTGLYALAAVGTLPLVVLAQQLPSQTFSFDVWSSLRQAKGYKTLALLEGVISIVPLALVPALSTLFFPTPQSFGVFITLVGLASAAAMIILARKSDAVEKRKKYLVPLSVLAVAALGAAIFASDAVQWTMFNAAFGFLYALASPLRNAVILDKKSPSEDAMANREFLLNVGRVAGLVFSAFVLWMQTPLWALAPAVVAHLAYAAVLAKKQWVL